MHEAEDGKYKKDAGDYSVPTHLYAFVGCVTWIRRCYSGCYLSSRGERSALNRQIENERCFFKTNGKWTEDWRG